MNPQHTLINRHLIEAHPNKSACTPFAPILWRERIPTGDAGNPYPEGGIPATDLTRLKVEERPLSFSVNL